ncbi:MAG: glycosyltransferase family 87 protein [Candidatus Methylacidiphilales bacterium]|nr:glycosyltransferase family 87 protein [Candidatus Methylacidiphilales bacterium]
MERAFRLLLPVIALSTACVLWIGLAHTWNEARGIMSPLGVPMGADLLQHHEAARFAAEGRWKDLYGGSALGRALYQRTHDGEARSVSGFNYVYPPLVAMTGAPFAAMPYLGWVACWQLAILVFYAASHALCAPWRPHGLNIHLVAFGLPVFYFGLILAQNSALSLFILTIVAILLAGKRPLMAGVVLSCLFYKPQIGLAVAGFLLVAGHGRAALAFGAGTLGWLAVGWVLCGSEATLGWFAVLRDMLGGAQNQVAALHQSLPGTIKVLLGPGTSALVAPLITLAGLACFGGLALWERHRQPRHPENPELAVFLALAAWALFSPYVMHYDLLLAVPWWWWNLRSDLKPGTAPALRVSGIAAAVIFWIATLLAINTPDLPVSPALPFLALWFCWTAIRHFRLPLPFLGSLTIQTNQTSRTPAK